MKDLEMGLEMQYLNFFNRFFLCLKIVNLALSPKSVLILNVCRLKTRLLPVPSMYPVKFACLLDENDNFVAAAASTNGFGKWVQKWI